jgi:hypothetical protein
MLSVAWSRFASTPWAIEALDNLRPARSWCRCTAGGPLTVKACLHGAARRRPALNNETTIILQYNNPTVQQGMPLPARFSAGKKRFVKITLVTPKSDNNPGRPAKIEILNESEYMLSDGNGSLTVADE